MGYLSKCNAESAIATCDPYNWDRKKRKNKPKNKPVRIRDFTYHQLVKATNGFSAESFLGKGSHGTVYKAILDDGKLIAAVKKTFPVHNNCSSCTAPAENEIEILSRIHHPRLVNLIGYCADRKLLVIEYMHNGSLHSLLHGSSKPLGWTRRVRFALQIAKAVHALHDAHPPVIHRDIKSSNVLIDDKWKARLGDFGLAQVEEDVSLKCTPPAGTLGYLDPAYLAPGDLSTKSDVFSFGILLLEIISGRNAIDVGYSPPSVVDWAVPLIKKGDLLAICDRRIGSPVDSGVINVLAVLAAKCVRTTAEKRPAMAEVVEALQFASKEVHAPLLWNRLRRRVVETQQFDTAVDSTEEAVVVHGNPNKPSLRTGSRRNRKVSSVSSIDYGRITIGERVTRSKSIGSFGEIKMNGSEYRRKAVGGGVAVKIPLVKLSKSRSMGVLHNPNILQYSNNINRGFMFTNPGETESPDSKLFIGLDEKSELQMQEKPLVAV